MSDSQLGAVYLVGAGPGDPGLITVRGLELLRSCDAVVYDDLIPWELIVALPERIERHYVGKRAGRPSPVQIEINELLADLASKGEMVVRLKGGDSLLFSRAGEELDHLRRFGVPVEVVPGVTAASAAAAAAGVPLTDRRRASWLLLATGHSAESDSPAVPWNRLGGAEGGNFAIYMGLGAAAHIIKQLKSGGLAGDTPVIAASKIGSAGERLVTGQLNDIVQRLEVEQVEAPAVLLIGTTFSQLHPMSSGQTLALQSKRVLVTRPANQIRTICKLLREQGAEPIPLPTIRVEPFNDAQGWLQFDQAIAGGGWCLFTSEAGVEEFISQLISRGCDIRALGRFRIAAIGSGTAKSLSQYGIKPDLTPLIFTREALADALKLTGNLSGQTVIRVRGNRGDVALEQELSKAGARIIPLTVYSTLNAVWDEHWRVQILDRPPHFLIFTSGSTVEGFVEIMGAQNAQKIANAGRVAVIGSSTAAVAFKLGLPVHIIAREHSVEGLVQGIVDDSTVNPPLPAQSAE